MPHVATMRLTVSVLVLLLLAPCSALRAQVRADTSARADTPVADLAADDATPLVACLDSLAPAARAARVNAVTWQQHTTGLARDPRVLANLDAQPEFRLAVWDYLAVMVDDERIADGASQRDAHGATLAATAERHGVDAETLLAVWGVESDYGRGIGRYDLLRSLATLSCEGRRQRYFRSEFFALLRLLQRGDVRADTLRGSWAGAFGLVQFMPSTFERLAVDADGDGRRDLVGSVPDAMASAARFLRDAGWRTGQPWGFEVRLPADFRARGEGRRTKRTLATWSARGVRRADGSPLVGGSLTRATTAGLLLPAGPDGPAFLVLRNFDAIYRYNASESYALAIAHLADRLRGGTPFMTPWPTDDGGLSRAERRELQSLLLARGHDIGPVDGLLGARTIAAVRLEQVARRMDVTGRPGQRLLQALREPTPR
jgi:glucose-6-phosphate 1-epimerase